MIKNLIKTLFRYPKGYVFKYSPAIRHQSIEFDYAGRTFSIEADGTTPLYETIYEIIQHDCYQLQKIDFTKFTKDSVALDIGGNIGIFSVILSALFPGKILCLEPILENCAFIATNLKKNNITNVQIISKALGPKNQKIRFYKTIESVSGSLLPFEGASILDVEGMSVQSLIDAYPNIDFVKLDCEGSEHEIIPQFLDSLSGIKCFSAEIHDRDKYTNVAYLSRLLRSSGYLITTKPENFERRGLSCLLAISQP